MSDDYGESSHGIQALIDTLRQDGVTAGEEEGKRIVSEAETRAEWIIQQAEQEAGQIFESLQQLENAAEIERSEIVVAIDSVGICGSDMHAYHGHDARRVPPLILGHEAAGEVLSGRYEGERVAAAGIARVAGRRRPSACARAV